MKNTVKAELARALFVTAWVEYEDENGRSHSGNLYDIAPKTPVAATKAADKILKRLEALNKCTTSALLNKAWKADGKSGAPSAAFAKELGHYLVPMLEESGQDWTDRHEAFPLKLFRVDASCYKEGRALMFQCIV